MNAGDYIKGVTSGGVLFNGVIHSIFNDGGCSVVPDGGKVSIPFHKDQICEVVKPIKRDAHKPKKLDKTHIEASINRMIENGVYNIDIPSVFSSMGEHSLKVREKNADLTVSVLLDYVTMGILKRHDSYNGIMFEAIEKA